MTWIVPAAMGVAQLGMGIWQSIKTTKERKKVDAETKAQGVPGELYDNKGLTNELRQDALQTKGIQESQAMDRDVMRRTAGANISSSPAGRIQTDIASNVEKGVDVNAIYADYRKSLAQTAALEMGINSEISKTKLDVFNQNLQVRDRNDEMYNKRQMAWAELMNAGMSNVAGAFQSRQNTMTMNQQTGNETAMNLANEATKYISSGDPNIERIDKMIRLGDFSRAQRIINTYK
jgi:hypothetical protein